MVDASKPQLDDEINLIEVFQILWNDKWKIVGAVAVSVLGMFGYQSIQPPPKFEATTEIKPITTVEAEKYRPLNTLDFFEISRSMLLNAYIEQLEDSTLFEEAIREYELIDREAFADQQDFDDAVISLASSIEILPPINVDGTKRGVVRRFWTVRFEVQ